MDRSNSSFYIIAFGAVELFIILIVLGLHVNLIYDLFKPDYRLIFRPKTNYALSSFKCEKIGQYFRPNDQREMWIFPKYAVGHLLAQVHI